MINSQAPPHTNDDDDDNEEDYGFRARDSMVIHRKHQKNCAKTTGKPHSLTNLPEFEMSQVENPELESPTKTKHKYQNLGIKGILRQSTTSTTKHLSKGLRKKKLTFDEKVQVYIVENWKQYNVDTSEMIYHQGDSTPKCCDKCQIF